MDQTEILIELKVMQRELARAAADIKELANGLTTTTVRNAGEIGELRGQVKALAGQVDSIREALMHSKDVGLAQAAKGLVINVEGSRNATYAGPVHGENLNFGQAGDVGGKP